MSEFAEAGGGVMWCTLSPKRRQLLDDSLVQALVAAEEPVPGLQRQDAAGLARLLALPVPELADLAPGPTWRVLDPDDVVRLAFVLAAADGVDTEDAAFHAVCGLLGAAAESGASLLVAPVG